MEFKESFKRQIEILGMTLSSHHTKADFEDMYECGKATIERDLEDLRSMGIDIHSEGKKGVCIGKSISPALLRDIVTYYLVLSHSAESYDKASALLVQTKKASAIAMIVQIQRAIESSLMVSIDYQKKLDSNEKKREVAPLMMFQREDSWRMLAIHDDIQKQFILNKVLSVQTTKTKFKRPPKEEIEKIFKNTFRSWLGSDEYAVKLHLTKTWGDEIKLKPVLEQQLLTEQSDGSYVLEGVVSSLSEFASWVVSRSRGVTVVSPKELKGIVIEIAEGALKNYK